MRAGLFPILLDIARCNLQYYLGKPGSAPYILTMSVTQRCNARCLACREWTTSDSAESGELSPLEYERFLATFPGKARYVALCGGEPFLRNDLEDIFGVVLERLSPDVVNIPSNGLEPGRVGAAALRMLRIGARVPTRLIINLSIDGIAEVHNRTRGVPDAYDRLMSTLSELRALEREWPNLRIAFHTGLSKLSGGDLGPLLELLKQIRPFTHILEPCVDRPELLREGVYVQPGVEEWKETLVRNKAAIAALAGSGDGLVNKVYGRLRAGYYRFAEQAMAEMRQVTPCLAGVSALYLASNGDVSSCYLRAPFANIRAMDYRFAHVASSAEGLAERRNVKNGKCCCSTSYCYYTSILHHPLQTLKVLAR